LTRQKQYKPISIEMEKQLDHQHGLFLYAVVTVYNNWDQLAKCVDTLTNSDLVTVRLVVVNHYPADHSKELIVPEPHSITIIQRDSNLWWVGAMNVGIQYAIDHGAEFLMLLNSDTFITNRESEKLLHACQQKEHAIVAPKQVDLESGNVTFSYATDCYLLGFPIINASTWVQKLSAYNKRNEIRTQMIIGGRGVIIPVSIFKKVGLFDEKHLPHYGADNDFYIRCRRAGIPLIVKMDCTILVDSNTSSMATRLGTMNFSRFVRSLTSRRSHRSYQSLVPLYRKYYPVPGMYLVGYSLNIARYTMVYLFARLGQILRRHQ
jgi:GT2 family glycosyltransferase